LIGHGDNFGRHAGIKSQKPPTAKKFATGKGLDFRRGLRHLVDMKFILSAHNVTLTKAIEDHVLSRIEKLEHMDRYVTSARVTLDHDHLKPTGEQFCCGIRLSMPGPAIFARDWEADLYSAIDLVTKKIEQQLRKRHSKNKARKHTVGALSKRSRQLTEQ
jgi:putative sigma-54 modulation protein